MEEEADGVFECATVNLKAFLTISIHFSNNGWKLDSFRKKGAPLGPSSPPFPLLSSFTAVDKCCITATCWTVPWPIYSSISRGPKTEILQNAAARVNSENHQQLSSNLP